ncbi:hydantoinase B/oxoprolinase family protein [Salinicola rhizosphaerae]|uniref:N-methylhydantoinase B n=1 Tax=Salinicola rhizosphaerae TaxID=1443141 RepID=A0ABQ3DXG0_9GAMM|nr:hydantoinase B/oxoprolinase family protein [Salinicola rhizosphaerae]GHB17150.1 N-methylhydantoinase B [Salinicola rhizosphaerae]
MSANNPNNRTLDPIALSLLWGSFVSVTDEMGSTLRKTAHSQAVREADDFSTAVFDAKGQLVAQGNFTPGHMGAMPFVVKSVLDYYPLETFEPGDGVLLNDSAMGSGHFPDFYLVSPVFFRDELVGFVVNIAHQIDVGGAAPGSQKVLGVTEAYQEGIRILPTKVIRGGEFDEQIMRMICANVRLPEHLRGDMSAQRNANHIGALRVRTIFEKFGVEDVATGIEEILTRSEKTVRDLIREIPNGTWSFEDALDSYEIGGEPIRVAVDVIIEDEAVKVDFSRSSDQVPAAINAYMNFTRAHAMFAVRAFTDPFMPQNAGSIRPVSVVGREGSFFNPVFPAPSGGRAAIQVRIFEAINGALAPLLKERAMGGFSHWSNPIIGGVDERTGESFIYYDLIFGGYGARSHADGVEALAPVINCANIPVEIHEAFNPIKIQRLELIPDSGGAGKYRGGCGMRKDLEIRTGEVSLTLLGDRHARAPYGLFGAESGALASSILNPDGEARELHSKETCTLKRGDVLSLRLAGGGGYGAVSERDPAKIQVDIDEGYVSESAARERYGYGS